MILFNSPQYLLLFALVPFIIFIHFMSLRTRKSKAMTFANFQAIARIKGIDLYSKNIVILILSVIVCSLIILSLSGMTIQRELLSSSSSFVIAIDSSGSMSADDIYPSRIDVAKTTALDFVSSLPAGTRIGVISFSGAVLLENDLTEDLSLTKNAIKDIELSSIGGTDLSEAISVSASILRNEQIKSVVVLSDGQINIGGLESAINLAKENSLVVYTIALGTESGGNTIYGISKLDEDSLKSLAYDSGGKFFTAGNQKELDDSFDEILSLKLKIVPFNLSKYLILIALMIFIIEYILLSTKYSSLP